MPQSGGSAWDYIDEVQEWCRRKPLLTAAVTVTVVLWLGAGFLPVALLVTGISSFVLAVAILLIGTARICFDRPRQRSIGFLHPFADGGGGGERVLWCAVRSVQQSHPDWKVVLYSKAGSSAEELVAEAARRFNISVRPEIEVVQLTRVHLLLPAAWPRATLLGQALGAVVVGVEALGKHVPQVFVETCGCPFAMPLARACGCRVVCYVHYPTLSVNMLSRVSSGTAMYNNDTAVAGSHLLTGVKLVYYYFFAALYGLVGATANVVMVNSYWTCGHIQQLWWRSSAPLVVWPPCDTKQLQELPLDRPLKRLYLISVAQFRPEKNHELQLEAFAQALELARNDLLSRMHLASLRIVGGCRDAMDKALLQRLKERAEALGIAERVQFHENVPFAELKLLLGGALGGLHTMLDEHFGISIVEYMAAGIVPIAHNSGGPRDDIIGPAATEEGGGERVGWLATDADEYARAIIQVLDLAPEERMLIAAAGRARASRFSERCFEEGFSKALWGGSP